MTRANVTFRRFQESDKADVLDIAKRTWGGHDHLPSILDSWLEDPANHPIVAATKKRVISVGNVKIIEEGKTAWMEGLRVLPWYRKRGLGREITNRLVERAYELKAKRIRLTLALENNATVRLAESLGMKRLAEYFVLWKSLMPAIEWRNEEDAVERARVEEWIKVARSLNGIIPADVVVYHWYALDMSPESLQRISATFDLWVSRRGSLPSGLSLSTLREEVTGLEWCATLYPSDETSFLSHLSHQLELAMSANASGMALNIPVKSEETLNAIPWMKKKIHSLHLGLYEKIL